MEITKKKKKNTSTNKIFCQNNLKEEYRILYRDKYTLEYKIWNISM